MLNKILILNYEWPPLGGGGGPVAEALAIAYADAGKEVHVITTHFKGQPKHEVRTGVHIHRVKAWRRKLETCETPEMLTFVMAAIIPALKFCRKYQPDVIHCHFAIPTGLVARVVSRLTGIPYILSCHGSDIPGHNPLRFKLAHKITPPIVRSVLKEARAIITPSQFLADHITSTLGHFPRLTIIRNAINVGHYDPVPKSTPPRILITGRLLGFKGYKETLLALQGLDYDFEVHIAGDGPQRQELEQIARGISQKVVFHGWLDRNSQELKQLYETSTILSMPSERETAGMSLIEGMAAGMAVVTSDCPACVDTVGNGQFGDVVPYGDVEALRKVFTRLLADLKSTLEAGDEARSWVREEFQLHRITQEHLILLEQAAKERQS